MSNMARGSLLQRYIDYWSAPAGSETRDERKNRLGAFQDPLEAFTLVHEDGPPQTDFTGRIKAEGHTCRWEGEVTPEISSGFNSLSGASAGLILDMLTSYAIMSFATEAFWGLPNISGATLNMNLNFHDPVPVGTIISIQTRIKSITKVFATVSCEISDKETGKLLVSGTHMKTWRGGSQRDFERVEKYVKGSEAKAVRAKL